MTGIDFACLVLFAVSMGIIFVLSMCANRGRKDV